MTITATRCIRIDVPGATTVGEAVAIAYQNGSARKAMEESGWSFAEVKDAPEVCECGLHLKNAPWTPIRQPNDSEVPA